MKLKPGAGVVMRDRNGKFLLQLRDNRKNIPDPNKWGLFGGGIKEGELPIDTVIREMKEELELKLKKEDLSLEYTYNHHKHYLFLYKKTIDPTKLKLHEGQAFGLFSRMQIIFMKGVALRTRLFFIFHNFNRN